MGEGMLAGDFMDRGDPEIPWIVERFIARGTVTTLWATQGRGKTHNMIRLVDAVAGNKDSFLGLPVKFHGPCLYLVAETPGMFKQALVSHPGGFPRDNVLIMPGWSLRTADGWLKFGAICRGAAVVVLDPVTSLDWAVKISDNDVVNDIMRRFDQIASKTGAAIILVLHRKKVTHAEAEYGSEEAEEASALGAVAWLAKAAGRFQLLKDRRHGLRRGRARFRRLKCSSSRQTNSDSMRCGGTIGARVLSLWAGKSLSPKIRRVRAHDRRAFPVAQRLTRSHRGKVAGFPDDILPRARTQAPRSPSDQGRHARIRAKDGKAKRRSSPWTRRPLSRAGRVDCRPDFGERRGPDSARAYFRLGDRDTVSLPEGARHMTASPWIGRCSVNPFCGFETGNSDVLAAHYRNVHGIGRPSAPRPSPPTPPARVSSHAPPSPANRLGRIPDSTRSNVSPKSADGLLAQISLRLDRVARTRFALARLIEYNHYRGMPVRVLAGLTGYSERRVRELLTLAAQERQESA